MSLLDDLRRETEIDKLSPQKQIQVVNFFIASIPNPSRPLYREPDQPIFPEHVPEISRISKSSYSNVLAPVNFSKSSFEHLNPDVDYDSAYRYFVKANNAIDAYFKSINEYLERGPSKIGFTNPLTRDYYTINYNPDNPVNIKLIEETNQLFKNLISVFSANPAGSITEMINAFENKYKNPDSLGHIAKDKINPEKVISFIEKINAKKDTLPPIITLKGPASESLKEFESERTIHPEKVSSFVESLSVKEKSQDLSASQEIQEKIDLLKLIKESGGPILPSDIVGILNEGKDLLTEDQRKELVDLAKGV